MLFFKKSEIVRYRDIAISRYLVLVIFKGSLLVQWPKRNTRILIFTCFIKMSSCSPHHYFYLPLLLLILFRPCVAIGAMVSAAFSGLNSVVRSSGYHGDGRYSGSFGGERHLGEEEQCAMQ